MTNKISLVSLIPRNTWPSNFYLVESKMSWMIKEISRSELVQVVRPFADEPYTIRE